MKEILIILLRNMNKVIDLFWTNMYTMMKGYRSTLCLLVLITMLMLEKCTSCNNITQSDEQQLMYVIQFRFLYLMELKKGSDIHEGTLSAEKMLQLFLSPCLTGCMEMNDVCENYIDSNIIDILPTPYDTINSDGYCSPSTDPSNECYVMNGIVTVRALGKINQITPHFHQAVKQAMDIEPSSPIERWRFIQSEPTTFYTSDLNNESEFYVKLTSGLILSVAAAVVSFFILVVTFSFLRGANGSKYDEKEPSRLGIASGNYNVFGSDFYHEPSLTESPDNSESITIPPSLFQNVEYSSSESVSEISSMSDGSLSISMSTPTRIVEESGVIRLEQDTIMGNEQSI